MIRLIDCTGRRLRASQALFALAVLIWGCQKANVLVPRGPHRIDQEPGPVRVRSPPPPANIEVLPLRRNPSCFYLDGHHEPRGGGWVWQQGAWILPPAHCAYAPPRTSYEQIAGGTTLVYRAGAWHPKKLGGQPCDAPKSCPDPGVQDVSPPPTDEVESSTK